MNIIEQLKKNEKAFGLMSEEMQAKAVCIGKRQTFETWTQEKWELANSDIFHADYTYRLNPDFQEQPSVIEFGVIERKGWLCVERQIGHDKYTAMDSCIASPDFIGFKYKDGTISPLARIYRHSENHHVPFLYTNDVPLSQVLTPTAVLFKGEPNERQDI